MSPDEVVVTLGSVLAGPVLWVVWLLRMSRLPRPATGIRAIAVTLAACAALIFGVLTTAASHDVVNDYRYVFMYLVLGLAWLRLAELSFAFAGLSVRDDLLERRNTAAVPAVAGAFVGAALCYAGGNIGDGPGWWVVVFSAGFATLLLLVVWIALTQVSPVGDAVTIDRDPAAGVRLGAFLGACGLVLGRGVAGTWQSAIQTVVDARQTVPALLVLLAVAVVVERLARPTSDRPHAPMFLMGVLPSVVYAAIAVAAVSSMGWPS